MHTLSLVILGIVLVAGIGGISIDSAPAGEQPAQAPLRQIPGLTAPDQFPRGCVDCHVNRSDPKMDVRLSTLMRQWRDTVDPTLLARVRAFAPVDMPIKGKHPKVAVAEAEIPKACLKCHSQASKFAPPLSRLLHGLHLVGGEKNHFVTMFRGECTHCHMLDTTTGIWSLKNGTEEP